MNRTDSKTGTIEFLVKFRKLIVHWAVTSYNRKQEAQLMLTNLRDALRGQSRSPNIVPFHMLGIFPLVQLSLRRAVFPIFDFKKCRDLEIRIRGHPRSLKVVPFGCGFLLVFYRNSVRKTHGIWDIIRLQKCHDLENRVRSVKVIGNVTMW